MATAADHMLYIQEKVNPILEQLVTQLLLNRPEEPAPFMVRWLRDKHKETGFASIAGDGETIAELEAQLETLKARKAELVARQ